MAYYDKISDLEEEYEHRHPPEDAVGVDEVFVSAYNDRCTDFAIVFYDTREVRDMIWLPQRLVNLNWGQIAEEDDLTPESTATDVHHLRNGFYWTGAIVADTPGTRGLLTELQDFEEWHKKSITGKGCYLAKLIHSLTSLWD